MEIDIEKQSKRDKRKAEPRPDVRNILNKPVASSPQAPLPSNNACFSGKAKKIERRFKAM